MQRHRDWFRLRASSADFGWRNDFPNNRHVCGRVLLYSSCRLPDTRVTLSFGTFVRSLPWQAGVLSGALRFWISLVWTLSYFSDYILRGLCFTSRISVGNWDRNSVARISCEIMFVFGNLLADWKARLTMLLSNRDLSLCDDQRNHIDGTYGFSREKVQWER